MVCALRPQKRHAVIFALLRGLPCRVLDLIEMRSVGAVHGDGIQRGGEFVLQFGDAFALRGKRRTHVEADAAAEAVRFAVIGGGGLDDEISARR